MSLNAKRIVVVGGTSGIGFAIAEAALRENAEVIVASSKAAHVEDAVKRLSGRVSGRTLDVTDENAVQACFNELGSIDHLAFTAGDWGARGGTLAELDLERAHSGFTVRFWGALSVIKHAHKSITAGGSITLTDGMVAHRPSKHSFLSTAMAGAVEHLARGLALDLAPIRVNVVCPGLIRTGVWDVIPADRREDVITRMTRRQPLPRIGEPNEVAEAYLYLMRAGYTTGQVLHVDGGGSVV
jgi:NAD(P)-dependent dehydrogenase (short-subunit alcohol dehydrogenase family)